MTRGRILFDNNKSLGLYPKHVYVRRPYWRATSLVPKAFYGRCKTNKGNLKCHCAFLSVHLLSQNITHWVFKIKLDSLSEVS